MLESNHGDVWLGQRHAVKLLAVTGRWHTPTHPPIHRDPWYPKVARLSFRPLIRLIPLRAGTWGDTFLLRIGGIVRVRLDVLRV